MTKTTPLRHPNIPAEAQWDDEDKEWVLGETTAKTSGQHKPSTIRVGLWRYWRQDGTLCCEATFNKFGALDGTNTRFHPDGSMILPQSHGHPTKRLFWLQKLPG